MKVLIVGGIALIGIIVGFIYFIQPMFLFGTTDAYMRFNFNTKYDQQCEKIGLQYLINKNVSYPNGFICSSWLERSGYPSRSKCGCYRGTKNGMEVYEFVKTTNTKDKQEVMK